MIGIDLIERNLLQKLDSLEVGHCLEIRTYKRNRSILFVKVSDSTFRVCENGYRVKTFDVSRPKIKKVLKGLIKFEFPRSRKVRLYDLGRYDPARHDSMGRKKL